MQMDVLERAHQIHRLALRFQTRPGRRPVRSTGGQNESSPTTFSKRVGRHRPGCRSRTISKGRGEQGHHGRMALVFAGNLCDWWGDRGAGRRCPWRERSSGSTTWCGPSPGPRRWAARGNLSPPSQSQLARQRDRGAGRLPPAQQASSASPPAVTRPLRVRGPSRAASTRKREASR